MISFLLACALASTVAWHPQLQAFLTAHRDLSFYLLLAVLVSIPARFVGLGAAYLLELLVVGWSRSSLRMLVKSQPSVRLDVLAILTMLLLPHHRIGYLLSFGLLYAVDHYTAQLPHISLTPLIPLWVLQMLCFVLFQSLVQYWLHRMEHAVPALWALHKFHHSADRMSIITSARGTQFLGGIEATLTVVPMSLITSPVLPFPAVGSPTFAVAILFLTYRTFIVMNGYFCHSNFATGYGWIGRWLIVSPRMHRLHHAVSPAYHNKNFSNDFVIWDRLFGTYAACDAGVDVRAIPVGLHDNPFNRHLTTGGALREYFLTTYLVFWRELCRGVSAWLPASTSRTAQAGAQLGHE
jgi:sterol desaturase/sphingolipid hydroxylase (fatty acid hydroxylase superfamily)